MALSKHIKPPMLITSMLLPHSLQGPLSCSSSQMAALKPPSRQPGVCCYVVVAAAYINRGGRPDLLD